MTPLQTPAPSPDRPPRDDTGPEMGSSGLLEVARLVNDAENAHICDQEHHAH